MRTLYFISINIIFTSFMSNNFTYGNIKYINQHDFIDVDNMPLEIDQEADFDYSSASYDGRYNIMSLKKHIFTNRLGFATILKLEEFTKYDKELSIMCINKEFIEDLQYMHTANIDGEIYSIASRQKNLLDRYNKSKNTSIYIFQHSNTSNCKVYEFDINSIK